jgi:hypothetical protein
MTTTGVAFFAYNNATIDYSKISVLAALYIKRHMKNSNTCLITDQWTWDWLIEHCGKKFAYSAFDEIIVDNVEHPSNIRNNYDSPWTKFKSEFKNSNKHSIIDYTPFDRTLLLDIDFIVQNNDLDYVFETNESIAVYHDAESIIRLCPGPNEQFLYEHGIPMLWSTAIYFDKHQIESKMFFDLWAHVSENYDFYKFLYGFPGTLYRTDYCVSIASHILNGMNKGSVIGKLPGKMINMSQKDDIAKINSLDDWIYLINDTQENWKYTLARVKNENIHVMNKRALERHYPNIMSLFEE